MIIIPRRKLVVLVLFTIFFAVAVHILKIPDESAFSGEITKTVIIDAGHGLPDGGAVGMNGTIESTLNIKIAEEIFHVVKLLYKIICIINNNKLCKKWNCIVANILFVL